MRHLLVALAALAAGTATAQGLTTVSATVQAGRDDERVRILTRELDVETVRATQAKDADEQARAANNIAALKREIERTTGRTGRDFALSAVAERRQKPAATEALSPALSTEVLIRARRFQPQEIKQ